MKRSRITLRTPRTVYKVVVNRGYTAYLDLADTNRYVSLSHKDGKVMDCCGVSDEDRDAIVYHFENELF